MKQVTGSNTPQATNKVSIQLTLDGHSFSAHGLDGEFPGEEPVEAELLTARTMLVPEEVLGTGDAGTLLAANGMAPAAEERAVCSLPVQGIVAVMAAHREALRQVEEKLGDRIRYTTPLLREVQAGTPTVWAYRTAGLLYIKVYDGSLRFAGVIPAPDTADVCYFTERLQNSQRKIQGAGHQPAAQPAGTPDDRFRQGKPVQRTGQPGGFRAVRRARPLCRDGVDKL